MVQKVFAAMMKSHTLHSVHAHLSPTQAAQAVSVSRWTIMRAIKVHELKATRDNRNHWKIDPDELNRWSASTVRTVEVAHPGTPQTTVLNRSLVSRHLSLKTANFANVFQI